MPMVAEANQMSQELKKVTQSVGIGPQRSMGGGEEGGVCFGNPYIKVFR